MCPNAAPSSKNAAAPATDTLSSTDPAERQPGSDRRLAEIKMAPIATQGNAIGASAMCMAPPPRTGRLRAT